MSLNTLFWIVLGALAAVIIGAIGWYSYKRSQLGHARIKFDKKAMRREPKIQGKEEEYQDDTVRVITPGMPKDVENIQEETEITVSPEFVHSDVKKIKVHPDFVILRVLAQEGEDFSGYELLQGLLALNLRHGDMEIFHLEKEVDGKKHVYFSVASVKEPGTFNIHRMSTQRFFGVSFFVQISEQPDAKITFDEMLDSATRLTQQLEGRLLDEQGRSLTPNVIEELQEKVGQAVAS